MKRNALIALGSVVALVAMAPSLAADPGRGAEILCYLWANNASPAIGTPYTPSSTWSYNTVGRYQANTVTKTATGTYTVVCGGVGGGSIPGVAGGPDAEYAEERGMSTDRAAHQGGEAAQPEASGSWGSGGHIQVTAYGTEDADQCKISSWSTGGVNLTATVKCYNHAGVASDHRFNFLFVW